MQEHPSLADVESEADCAYVRTLFVHALHSLGLAAPAPQFLVPHSPLDLSPLEELTLSLLCALSTRHLGGICTA